MPIPNRMRKIRSSLAVSDASSRVDRLQRFLILDEVAETAVILVTERCLDREWLPGKPQDPAHVFQRHAELSGKLLGGRFTADLVEHLPRRAHYLVGHLDHVHGNANGPGLVRDRASDRLA